MKYFQKITALHLISSTAFLGAERVVCELAACLNPSRFNVKIGLLGSPPEVVEAFKNALAGTSAEVIEFTCDGKISFFSLISIKRFMEDNKINIVHSHGYKSDFYALLANLLSKNHAVSVATNHNWITSSIKERVYKTIDALTLLKFNAVVAVSNVLKNEIIEKGVKSEKVKVISNGIDINICNSLELRDSTRVDLGLTKSHFVIGCVASLTHEKAHSDLLQAFAVVVKTIPESRLVIVGSGILLEELRALATTLGIKEYVVFAGYRKDARALYIVFDVFALVSLTEGLPMAMLEAMATSLPVVVSAVGAIPQVITSMENGILTKPGDIDAIAKSFIKLALDTELRKSLGCNARRDVVENYSVSRMARDYETLYDKVMESRV